MKARSRMAVSSKLDVTASRESVSHYMRVDSQTPIVDEQQEKDLK